MISRSLGVCYLYLIRFLDGANALKDFLKRPENRKSGATDKRQKEDFVSVVSRESNLKIEFKLCGKTAKERHAFEINLIFSSSFFAHFAQAYRTYIRRQ